MTQMTHKSGTCVICVICVIGPPCPEGSSLERGSRLPTRVAGCLAGGAASVALRIATAEAL
jgi:hypothetical protein